MTPLNEYLKISRKKAKLSQRDVGVRLGYYNGQFISNIERGECVVPPALLERMIKLYKIPRQKTMDIYFQSVLDKAKNRIDEVENDY